MTITTLRLLASTSVAAMTLTGATAALAQDDQVCTEDLSILAQPRDGLTTTEEYADEFEELSGVGFQIDYLNENDRRAKSRADASTIGRYDVYYIDEANLAQFAASDWIVPLLDYYPDEYDYEDFDPGLRTIATYDDQSWFAPIQGGGDLMVYRTDLLEEAGIEPPQTLEEFMSAVETLHDPDNEVYGIALRGRRGSGANVWRWMPYFQAAGGEWFDDEGNPAFNSDAAVEATETYLELFQYSAPGTQSGSFAESTGAFNSGQVALIVESAPLGAMSLDPSVSSVTENVGFGTPPTPLPGAGYAHGFAIGARANPSEEEKACAGLWIAWATSKENEQRRLEAGQPGELTRTSIFESEEFSNQFGEELPAALNATGEVTDITFWQNEQWPQLGDRWGIILEELITGQRDDIPAALDELEEFANELTAG